VLYAMSNSGPGEELPNDDYITAVHDALETVSPRPVVDSQEIADQLDVDVNPQTVRRRLKEIRHHSEISGYSTPKWLWYVEED